MSGPSPSPLDMLRLGASWFFLDVALTYKQPLALHLDVSAAMGPCSAWVLVRNGSLGSGEPRAVRQRRSRGSCPSPGALVVSSHFRLNCAWGIHAEPSMLSLLQWEPSGAHSGRRATLIEPRHRHHRPSLDSVDRDRTRSGGQESTMAPNKTQGIDPWMQGTARPSLSPDPGPGTCRDVDDAACILGGQKDITVLCPPVVPVATRGPPNT